MKIIFRNIVLVFLLILFPLNAIFANSGIKNDVIIARVNGHNITVDEFKTLYEFAPAFIFRKENPKKRFLEFLINERLFSLDAQKSKMDTLPIVKNYLEEIKHDLITEELFKDDVLNKIEIKDSDVEKIVNQKNCIIRLQWLHSKEKESIINKNNLLNTLGFDSLYTKELKEQKFNDDREIESNLFNILKNRPELERVIEELNNTNISAPVLLDDGWYIFKLASKETNLINTESDSHKLYKEAKSYLIKNKSDQKSNEYIDSLFLLENPIIKKNNFHIVRSYIAKLTLDNDKYSDWKFDEYLSSAIKRLNNKNVNDENLVVSKLNVVSINDFLFWFRNRIQFIKLDKTTEQNFSASIEKAIWRMVRDKLLIKEAQERGYEKYNSVKKHLSWWKYKILFSTARNEIQKSIKLKDGEIKNKHDIENSLALKLYRKSIKLRDEAKIEINHSLLEKVSVRQTYDPQAIELYLAKKNGLFPREAFPTIDRIWANVE